MSGRRRVKNIAYDKDDYWDGDEDHWDQNEEEDPVKNYKRRAASFVHTGGGRGTLPGAISKMVLPPTTSGRYGAHSHRQQRKALAILAKTAIAFNPPSASCPTSSTYATVQDVASQGLERAIASTSQKNDLPPSARGSVHAVPSKEAANDIKREAVNADKATSGFCEEGIQGREDLLSPDGCIVAGNFAVHSSSSPTQPGERIYLKTTPALLSGTSAVIQASSSSKAVRQIESEAGTFKCSQDKRCGNKERIKWKTGTFVRARTFGSAQTFEGKSSATADARAEGGKSPYSLVVIGHVDAGKSTLTGQLLFRTGAVSGRDVAKMKKMSTSAGKGSFFYAWLCDEGDDERQRGLTIDVSCRVIVTAKQHRRISFLDAPGHRELVSNMLGGAVLADAALLVVDAARFEAGFEGQTREHLLIVRSFNIQHLVVAVNKMDEVDWSEQVYTTVVERLRAFLTGPEIAYPAQHIFFVPVSAFVGINLFSEESNEQFLTPSGATGAQEETGSSSEQHKLESLCSGAHLESQTKMLRSWWTGPSLLDFLENIEIKPFDAQRQLCSEPFAACVADMWLSSSSSEELNLSLKVASGCLRIGEQVAAFPANVVLVCRALSSYGVAGDTCACGDFVEKAVFVCAHSASLMDKHAPSAGVEAVGVGTVLCSSMRSLRIVSTFFCKVIVFSRELPLMSGRQLVAHVHTMTCQCIVRKIVAVIGKKTLKIVKQKQAKPCALVCGMAGIIEIDISPGKVGIQEKKEQPGQTSLLSRIILRDRTGTAAAGVVVGDTEV